MATIKYAIYGTGVYSKRFVEHNLNGGGGAYTALLNLSLMRSRLKERK